MNTKEMLTAYMLYIEHWALDIDNTVTILEVNEGITSGAVSYTVKIKDDTYAEGYFYVTIEVSEVLCWLTSKISKMGKKD